MIWITGLSLPDGSLQPEDAVYSQPDNQQHWLHQAYYQARSQLYIGVAVLQSLNAPVEARSYPGAVMLRPDGSMHPFYATLYDMSAQNGQNEMLLKPGKSKAGSLVKNRP
jgi:hypothetical protein